jgi:hypothetical protein
MLLTQILANIGCAPPGWQPPRALRRAAGDSTSQGVAEPDKAAQQYGLAAANTSSLNGARTRRPSTASGPGHNPLRPTRIHASHTPQQKALICSGEELDKVRDGEATALHDRKYVEVFQPATLQNTSEHASFQRSPMATKSGYDYSGSKTKLYLREGSDMLEITAGAEALSILEAKGWSVLRNKAAHELRGSRLSDSKPKRGMGAWPVQMLPKTGATHSVQDVNGIKKDLADLVGMPDKKPTDPEKHVKRTPFVTPSDEMAFLKPTGAGASSPAARGNLTARRRSIMLRQDAIEKSASQQPAPPLPCGPLHKTLTTPAWQPQPPAEHPSAPSQRPLHSETAKGSSSVPSTARCSAQKAQAEKDRAEGARGFLGLGERRKRHQGGGGNRSSADNTTRTLTLSPPTKQLDSRRRLDLSSDA